MANRDPNKKSAAEVVKQLTKENIQKAGQADPTVEGFQKSNLKVLGFLKWSVLVMGVCFLVMLVAVLYVTLQVQSARARIVTIEDEEIELSGKLGGLIDRGNGTWRQILDYNSGVGIPRMIISQLMKSKRKSIGLSSLQMLLNKFGKLPSAIKSQIVSQLGSGKPQAEWNLDGLYTYLENYETYKDIQTSTYKEFDDFGIEQTKKFDVNEFYQYPEYYLYLQKSEEVREKQTETTQLMTSIQNNNVDRVYPKTPTFVPIKDEDKWIYEKYTELDADVAKYNVLPKDHLLAYYPKYEASFFGHGCHIQNCDFSKGVINQFLKPAKVEECMEKCVLSRKRPAPDMYEYGFTYNYKDGSECFCKTSGVQQFYSDEAASDEAAYVYYRYN